MWLGTAMFELPPPVAKGISWSWAALIKTDEKGEGAIYRFDRPSGQD